MIDIDAVAAAIEALGIPARVVRSKPGCARIEDSAGRLRLPDKTREDLEGLLGMMGVRYEVMPMFGDLLVRLNQ